MDQAIQTIAHFLGISDAAVEGGAVVILLWIVYRLVLVIGGMVSQDDKQVYLEQTLVGLAADAVQESKLSRLAYEKNTEILSNIPAALENVGAVILRRFEDHETNMSALLQSSSVTLDSIQRQLFKGSPTTVVVQDASGAEVSRFTAVPQVDESGADILVVTFDNGFRVVQIDNKQEV